MWNRKRSSTGLTAADSAIWHTVAMNQALDDGAYDQLPQVATPFPSQLSITEQFLAKGTFLLRDVQAPANVSPDAGGLFVSTDGFYLHTVQGLHPWSFAAMTSAQMTDDRTLGFNGNSDRGPVTWVVESDWAALVFTLWARTVHPAHPQYVGHQWIPAGWADRVQSAGYGLPTHADQHHDDGSD